MRALETVWPFQLPMNSREPRGVERAKTRRLPSGESAGDWSEVWASAAPHGSNAQQSRGRSFMGAVNFSGFGKARF